MKFKIFSILGVALCGLLSTTASPVVPKEFLELEPRHNPVPYIFDPLPKLIDSSPTTRYYYFELRKTNLSPDGFERPVWTVNGQYPGPLIQANKGDRLVIKVINSLGEAATIHWHGIFQRKTNWYDGVPGQTQCPIPDGISFTYNFTLDQSGTYWYHSHFLAQYVDGVIGPLIVHDPKDDPYYNQCQDEYVVTIGDWYHDPTSVLLPLRMAPGYRGLNPVPDSILISGQGQYNCSSPAAGSNCNPNVTAATYNVQTGKKYRFRIINTSAYAFFFFSIDNHSLKIVEVEGTPVKDVDDATVNVLPIHAAQRYSVILTADQPIANYFIRCVIPDPCVPRPNNTINFNSSLTNATGILHYDGADTATYNVQTGKKYRFRIINTSAYAFFFFSIDNHSLKIVEVEGTPVKDVDDATVNVLPIHAAQRYSVILTADQPIANYFIRCVIPDPCVPRPNNTINFNSSLTNATGILHYDGADSNLPTSTAFPIDLPPCEDLNATAIRPYEDSPPPTVLTDDIFLNLTILPDAQNISVFRINNSTFVPIFDNPSNQRILQNGNFDDFETSQNAYGYDHPDGGVQITLINNLGTEHPFHLHGHAFWLIASGRGTDPQNLTTFNLVNPVIRDTATVPGRGHIVIRYIADNPGVWAFHCHIEWHVELGMVAQLIERPTDFSKETLPDDVKALCGAYNNSSHEKRSTILPGNSMAKKFQMFRKVK
ncbi:hypothetical protein Glove_173g15 [Diversispora epigaea]|uniref:Laccase n=1 Tax=Diversispora epigaea TaxID=1348612 RepID=A0A397IY03_9GLOM|nr:hypothetical protein Glove_173g15 [Diversispora epigaea]